MVTQSADLNKTRDFYTLADGHYIYDSTNVDGVLLEVSRVRRDSYGSLWGSLDVRTPKLAGARALDDIGTIVRFDSVNLSDLSKRRAVADACQFRAQTNPKELDWTRLLDEFSFRVGVAESRGDAAVWLSDVPHTPGEKRRTTLLTVFPYSAITLRFCLETAVR